MADMTIAPEKKACCQRILERTIPALEFAKQCQDCGYPVDDLIEQLVQHAEIARNTLNTFFPEPT